MSDIRTFERVTLGADETTRQKQSCERVKCVTALNPAMGNFLECLESEVFALRSGYEFINSR
jgi:hypothetical protein